MVKYEQQVGGAPADKREIVAGGKLYHHKTAQLCKVCNSDGDKNLFVKQKLRDAWVLECPVCETVQSVSPLTVTVVD